MFLRKRHDYDNVESVSNIDDVCDSLIRGKFIAIACKTTTTIYFQSISKSLYFSYWTKMKYSFYTSYTFYVE